MRFFCFILGSIGFHLALMVGLALTRPAILPTKGGEFCIEIRSSASSLPQQARVASSHVNQKHVEAMKRHVVKTAADSLQPYFDLAKRIEKEAKKDLEKKQAEKQAKNKGSDTATTSPSSSSTASAIKNQGVRVEARPKGNRSPTYPDEARSRGIEGEVQLKIRVLTTGRVEVLGIVKSSGYKVLDEAAIRHVRTMVYEPARVDNTPIVAEYKQPVTYRLMDS